MKRLTIAFLGPCHTSGYPGVPPDATFLEVARKAVEARRPDLKLDLLIEPVMHPAEFPRGVANVIARKAHIVVLEIVGWMAIHGRQSVDLTSLPRGVRGAYGRARHFRSVGRHLLRKIPHGPELVSKVSTSVVSLASGVLSPLLPRLPRATMGDYETLVDEAIVALKAVPGVSIVIQGPGELNPDLKGRFLATDAVERYKEVDAMARRLAEKHAALFIDRWSTITPKFYRPGNVRPTQAGHELWGHLLGEKLLAEGLV
jgi:hypothetical protein